MRRLGWGQSQKPLQCMLGEPPYPMPGHVGPGLDLGAGLLLSGCWLLSPSTAPASNTEHVAATVWPSATDLGSSPCSGVFLPDCEGLGGGTQPPEGSVSSSVRVRC